MANNFGQWVATRRKEAGLSQSELARQISVALGVKFPRDAVWRLEHGTPRSPDPDLVCAICIALGRPASEAVEALGYWLPGENQAVIHPTLGEALKAIPWAVQERLAEVLPRLLALAGELVASPDSVLRPRRIPDQDPPSEDDALQSSPRDP